MCFDSYQISALTPVAVSVLPTQSVVISSKVLKKGRRIVWKTAQLKTGNKSSPSAKKGPFMGVFIVVLTLVFDCWRNSELDLRNSSISIAFTSNQSHL